MTTLREALERMLTTYAGRDVPLELLRSLLAAHPVEPTPALDFDAARSALEEIIGDTAPFPYLATKFVELYNAAVRS